MSDLEARLVAILRGAPACQFPAPLRRLVRTIADAGWPEIIVED